MPESTGNATIPPHTLKVLRYGSLAVLGGYAVSICYRVGLFRKVLPATVNTKLENTVEAIKAKTEPLGDAKRFTLARNHLIKAYTWAAGGMVCVAAGVGVFAACPRIPIAIPIITAVVPSLLVVGVPKNLMRPAARALSFILATVSSGYVLGPIGYVAQDSILVLLLLTGCTMSGVCIPLFLTRGMISYVLSAQTLSMAAAIALVTTPVATKETSPFKTLKAQPGVQMILKADVNVMLTMQMLSNLVITLAHTVPTIHHFISWKGTEEDLLDSVDALKEASFICGGWVYIIARIVRSLTRVLMLRVADENEAKAQESARSGRRGGHVTLIRRSNVDVASGVVSGVVTCLLYVRLVSQMQQGDPKHTLATVRKVCARLSPLSVVLGSQPGSV